MGQGRLKQDKGGPSRVLRNQVQEVWGKERERGGGRLFKSKEALQVNDGPCLDPQTWTAAQTQTDDRRPEDGLARGERLILLPERINTFVF